MTPLLSSLSTTSSRLVSGTSSTVSATLTASGLRPERAATSFFERAISVLNEAVRGPWPGQRDAIALAAQIADRPGAELLEAAGVRLGDEKRRVQQQRSSLYRQF